MQSIYDNPGGMGRQPNTTSILGGIGGGNIEQLFSMFGPMIAQMMGAKGLGGGTFGGFGDFSSLQAMEQQRRFMQMTMQSKMSQEMQNADLMHVRSMLTGLGSMFGIGMNEQDMLSATGFLSNPMMMGALQISAPKVASMLFPNAGAAYTSAQSLYRGGFSPYMSPGMVAGYTEGALRGGGYDPSNPLLSVNPALSQGFMSGERANISSGLAARGLISIDRTGVSQADLDAILSGDEARAKEVGLRVSSRTNAQLKEFVPAYGFAKSVFGGEMPNMSESQVGDLLDSITGGLGGMNKGEMMTQIARIKEITETLPITATAVKNFIDSVVSVGQQVGVSGAMSAKMAVSALSSGQGMANSRINTFGNLPGMGTFGSDWFANEMVQRQMNTANSSLPGDVALLVDLGAGSTASLSGADKAIYEAAQRKASGKYSTEDFALLRGTTRERFQAIAGKLSGAGAPAIRGLFADDAVRKEAINRYDGLLEDTALDQVTDQFLNIKNSIGGLFKKGTSDDDMMDILMGVEAASSGGSLNQGALRNIVGNKLNALNDSSAAGLINLRGQSASAGWTKQLSALRAAARDPARLAASSTRKSKAKAASLMQELLGGTAPLERLVQGIQDGNLWSAVGFSDIKGTFGRLAGSDTYLDMISNAQTDDEFGAYVDAAASLIPDAERVKQFREAAKKIHQGPAGGRKAALKSLLQGQQNVEELSQADLWQMQNDDIDARAKSKQLDDGKKSVSEMNKDTLGSAIRDSLEGLTIKIKDETGTVVTDTKVNH